MGQIKHSKYTYLLLMLLIFTSNTQSLEPIIASVTFRRLASSEIYYLKNYLQQIEDIGGRCFKRHQVKNIIYHFDTADIYRRSPQEIAYTRKLFQRRKMMIAADWCYYNHQKMPNLTPLKQDTINLSEEWDLHHVQFLRLNGQNEWWNVMPIPRKDHHLVIHGKDQPGEILHKMLEDRFYYTEEFQL